MKTKRLKLIYPNHFDYVDVKKEFVDIFVKSCLSIKNDIISIEYPNGEMVYKQLELL